MIHPLSLFPSLLSYPLLAYFILRLVVAWGIVRIGLLRWKKPYKYIAFVDFIAALFVLIGLYTQAALIISILLLLKDYYLNWRAGTLDQKEKIILSILALISFALLFLGPGSFALDLPL